MAKKSNIIFLYILSSIIFLIFTNSNFTIEETYKFGGSDGFYYYLISENAPFFASEVEYIKGERFCLPYIIGIISKVFNLELFLTYKFFSLILFFYLFFLVSKILLKLNLSLFITLISLSLIIFNPYIFRYLYSIPTMIGDLAFMISIVIIFEGILFNNKKKIYVGFILACLLRQNGVFFLLTFISSKFLFKNKSLFKSSDIFKFLIIYIILFSINSTYALMSAPINENISELYYITLFGIFTEEYALKELILYIIFPFLSFGPIIFLLFTKKFKISGKLFSEFSFIFFLSSILIIGIAFISGPQVSGKNLLRLSNFIFPMLIIYLNTIFIKNNKYLNNFYYFLASSIFIIIWSLHPTFSKIKIFENLKDFF